MNVILADSVKSSMAEGRRIKCRFSAFSGMADGFTGVPIIETKICPDSIVYTGYFDGYDVLAVSKFKHYRISYSNKPFADHENQYSHINGIGNFCGPAKWHRRKFSACPLYAC